MLFFVAEADVSLSQDNNNQILPICNDGNDGHAAYDFYTYSFPQLSTPLSKIPNLPLLVLGFFLSSQGLP